jgi:hypothetical protein
MLDPQMIALSVVIFPKIMTELRNYDLIPHYVKEENNMLLGISRP